MQRIVNFFAGSVTVEVKGSYPERFLNLCARNGIGFWNMENCSLGVLRITVRAGNFRKLRPVAKKSMCRLHIVSKSGLPFLKKRVRKRDALIAGCAVFCLVAWIFTSFVWSVKVDGFDGLDEQKLLDRLSEEGLRIGAMHRKIDTENLRNSVLIDMPELSYIYVNFNGAEARVIARPRKSAPEILEENVPCDIIADKDGIIESITVKSGNPEVKRGEAVIRGQMLVSGYMTGRAGTTVTTHSDAEVSLRTFRRESAKMQRKISEKEFTGREKTQYTIILFGNRIKLYPNSRISYAKCDKIIKRNNLTVGDWLTLPLALESATLREYELCEGEMRDEQAYEIMGETLSNLVYAGECEVLDTKLFTHSDDAFSYAEITAECIEKTGVKRKLLKDG